MEQLKPKKLLSIVKKIAEKRGYDKNKISLSDDRHKLIYNHNGKIIKFGAKNYNDFPTYLYNAQKGNITFEEAINKMINYRKRAYKVMIKSDKYSPASLSYNLLWAY